MWRHFRTFGFLFSGSAEFDALGVSFRRIKFFLFLALSLLLPLSTTAFAAEPTPRSWPVEMLDAIGVGPSLRDSFQQGKLWDAPTEDEVLHTILYRLPEFPLHLSERWVFPWSDAGRQAVVADPGKWRGQFFRLRFQVLTLRRVTLGQEAARRLGFDEYYRLEVDLDGCLTTLFARTIPRAWQKKFLDKSDKSGDKPVSIDEPAGALAMFLKTGVEGEVGKKDKKASSDSKKDGKIVPMLYFAADRIAWYPRTAVGRLGMDVGLFDLIRDRRPIDGRERETFYQLLAAVSRAKPGALMKLAKAELGKEEDGFQKWTTAVALFNKPEQMRGRLVLLTGIVRRALRIEVRDTDIVERFGIRHYYELYLFTPGSRGNPIVVCAHDLPKGMPTGGGPDYREPIEVAGIMLKSWKFPSRENVREGEEKRQLAPLLIARKPIWIPEKEPPESLWLGPIAATLVVFALFLLWYFLRRQAKTDRAAAKRRRQNLS